MARPWPWTFVGLNTSSCLRCECHSCGSSCGVYTQMTKRLRGSDGSYVSLFGGPPVVSALQFEPLSSAPALTEGGMYYDDGTNTCSGVAGPRMYHQGEFLDIPLQKCGVLTTGFLEAAVGSTTTDLFQCTWTRTGKQVDYNIYVVWSAHTGTGNMTLTDALPYVSGSIAGTMFYSTSINASDGFVGGAGVQLGARIAEGSNDITLVDYDMDTGAAIGLAQGAQFQLTGLMYLSGTYRTDAAF